MKKLLIFLIVVLLAGCYEGVKWNTEPTKFKIIKVKSIETPKYKIAKYEVEFASNKNSFAYVWFTDSIGKYEVGDVITFVKK
jgi:hypothetical protein